MQFAELSEKTNPCPSWATERRKIVPSNSHAGTNQTYAPPTVRPTMTET